MNVEEKLDHDLKDFFQEKSIGMSKELRSQIVTKASTQQQLTTYKAPISRSVWWMILVFYFVGVGAALYTSGTTQFGFSWISKYWNDFTNWIILPEFTFSPTIPDLTITTIAIMTVMMAIGALYIFQTIGRNRLGLKTG